MITQAKDGSLMAVGVLPGDVLLDIFDFYRINHNDTHLAVWEWHILAHVCQTWRQVIFESPHRLDLQIPCTAGTPVRTSLGIWPDFPIAIDLPSILLKNSTASDEDNIIAALEHTDRVRYLRLQPTSLHLRKLANVVLPALTDLIILDDGQTMELPAEFLGGYAPRLQKIYFRNISFPDLPTLLLSASDLVELQLHMIPSDGYVSPNAMAVCLAELPRLKTLVIRFLYEFSIFRYDGVLLPSTTRTILPSLTMFEFAGYSMYLEDFVARIDTPRLNSILIMYFDFAQASQLSHFFDRSLGPFKHAKFHFDGQDISLKMTRPTVTAVILYPGSDRDISHVPGNLSAILSYVVNFKLMDSFRTSHPNDADELECLCQCLLHQFSTVQALYASRELAEFFAHALDTTTVEIVPEALSSLDLICLEDQPTSPVEKFFAFRKLSGRPVTVVNTEEEFDQRLASESYVTN